MDTFQRVGIIGAGTMGSGIAQLVASAGKEVLLYDMDSAALERGIARIREVIQSLEERGKLAGPEARAILERVLPQRSLDELGAAEMILEATIEDLQVKKNLMAEVAKFKRPQTILATNTSSLSVSAIAAATPTPALVVGLHFFNPAPVMRLVEVVRGRATSDTTINRAVAFCRELGKTTVVCADTPGFIVNRVARAFYGEAIRMLGEGLAPVEEIDRIMTLSGGFRMGPFELMDFIGIDVSYAVTCSVYEQFFQEPRFRPHPLQRQMVEAGTLGRKTGRGFYTYDTEPQS
ncbi:MAG: 3-hydroxyacyl-CoA dehydrogenase NAD-binding domain-containing protein [Bacteroidota bacterium]